MKPKLVWDEWNTIHIGKHNVAVSEVEEVYNSTSLIKRSYSGRLLIFGKTKQGRLMAIVIAPENNYVLSARDMSRKERREYYEQTETN